MRRDGKRKMARNGCDRILKTFVMDEVKWDSEEEGRQAGMVILDWLPLTHVLCMYPNTYMCLDIEATN